MEARILSSQTVDTIVSADRRSDPLAILAAIASTVLTEHTTEAGVCVVCGSAWPCAQVILAEHNLALI
jgi:hypothetical protein